MLSGNKTAAFGLAPELVNIDDVFSDAFDGYFKKSLALGGFEKNALFLGKPVSDSAITDLTTCRFSATETFDIVFIGFGHRGNSGENVQKCKLA
jgi:hypothetical protein